MRGIIYDYVLDRLRIDTGLNTSALSTNTIPVFVDGGVEDSFISYNPTLARMESSTPFYAPTLMSDSGSLVIGDSDISSGGRVITTRSLSTGNKAAFNLQLFDFTGYKKSTVFDHNQPVLQLPIQGSDDTVASGNIELNFTQVVQADVQFLKIRFKPEGGAITAPFTFQYSIDSSDTPAYKETIVVGDPNLTDLGGGVWELVLENPTIFDAGSLANIKTTGVSLLGGNGFTGPVVIGDPANNDFFPYLEAVSIIVARKDIATEDYVTGYTTSYTQAEKDKLASITGGQFLGVFADIAALELAYPTANIGDTATVTSPSGNLFYWKVPPGGWIDSGTGSSGDMLRTVYDPTSINASAFSMDNMLEGAGTKIMTNLERTKLDEIEASAEVNVQSDWNEASVIHDAYIKNKPTDLTILSSHASTELSDITDAGSGIIITNAERTKLGDQSGVNTGDQDLSGLALKSNVLGLDNTNVFTPDADYEPATKKYVDDIINTYTEKMVVQAFEYTTASNVTSDTNIIWGDDIYNPDGAYSAINGRITISQSWIDNYDYIKISMSTRAGWSGHSDGKKGELQMMYNDGGADKLYMLDGHCKLKGPEVRNDLMATHSPKIFLSNHSAGDYFLCKFKAGTGVDLMGGFDNSVEVSLIKE